MSRDDWLDRRKEPTFRTPSRSNGDDLRAEPDRSRPNSSMSRKRRAPEPDYDYHYEDEYEDEPPPPPRRKRRQGGHGGGDDGGNRRGPSGRQRHRRSFLGGLFYWCLVLGVWAVIAAGGLVVYHAGFLPPIDQLAIPKRPPNIAIMGDDGAQLANRGDTGGPAMHLSDLPPYLPKAFVAIEDRRFYVHYGIDPIGIGRAIFRNLARRGGMEGGSTITQQLAKNLFLTQERTLSRKVQEAILAVWLEHKYSKDQILELYLNRVYFGSGAYGVEAATMKYFGHSARFATLPEAALLAGLMKAPTKLAPNRNPVAAADRAAQVITAMAQAGHITESMAQLALSRPALAKREQGSGSINYAADYVMDVLDETVGAIDEDIVVTTTLSPFAQASAEHALTEALDKQGTRYGVSQGAVVSIDPSGQIKALVGGRNYSDSQFNRVVAAKRQPGSAFKPFVYLTALEKGLTPDTIREDAPINVRGWQPENSSRDYLGNVTLTKALAMSLNTVAVRVGLEVGAKAVANTAHRLGITADLQANASIALGTSEVTPLELVSAYAPFANGGIGVQPHIITKVRTADGKLLYQRKGASYGRVIDPNIVAMMNRMLQETLITGTARKADLPGWQAAGKTGTSQDYRDAWFVGYTTHLVTAVWLGNDDNSPTKKSSGANLPVDIWSRFMRETHKTVPPSQLSGAWTEPVAPASNVPASGAPSAGIPDVISGVVPPAPVGRAGAGTQISNTPLPNPASARTSATSRDTQRLEPMADLIPPAAITPSTAQRRLSAPPPEPESLLDRIFSR